VRTVALSVTLLALGIWAVWAITAGFVLLTSEQARRLDISRKQPTVTDARLIDKNGQAFRFGEWVKGNNKLVVVDFIYTNCQTLCRVLGNEFQQLQRAIVERGLQSRVQLLSVSFDPEHDSPLVLRQYAEHMQARADVWTFATVAQADDLNALLREFNVTVIPDQEGGFQHNAALVWLSPSGKMIRVTDYDSGDNLKILGEWVRQN
jgi:protein SCO1/2